MSYSVEILNLGRRPLPGVDSSTAVFDDEGDAVAAHCRAVGDLVLRPAMSLLGADRREEVADDGIMAAARLTHDTEGGRVEVILRRRRDEPPVTT